MHATVLHSHAENLRFAAPDAQSVRVVVFKFQFFRQFFASFKIMVVDSVRDKAGRGRRPKPKGTKLAHMTSITPDR